MLNLRSAVVNMDASMGRSADAWRSKLSGIRFVSITAEEFSVPLGSVAAYEDVDENDEASGIGHELDVIADAPSDEHGDSFRPQSLRLSRHPSDRNLRCDDGECNNREVRPRFCPLNTVLSPKDLTYYG